MNIAIFRTDRLGDMILTLPMCTVLRNEFPNAKIVIIARKENKELLSRCNYVFDEIIYEEDFAKWSPITIAKILKSKKIEMVFFPRPRYEELAGAWLARVKHRIGSGFRWYSIFLNYKVFDHRKEAKFHELEYNIRLMEFFLKKEVKKPTLIAPIIKTDEKESLKNKINSLANRKIERYIVIHPGSRGSSVDWHVDNFGKMAAEVSKRDTGDVIITGTGSEIEKCNRVKELCPESINLCGLMNLDEMSVLLSCANLVIANSTGILHLAAALNTPVLGLYPNDPSISKERWGPYSVNSEVITPKPNKVNGAWNNDMSLITVDEVLNTVIKYIDH